MIRVLYMSVVAASLLAGGCKLVPLNEITYPGTVSVSSSMSARVVVIPGSGLQTGPSIGPGVVFLFMGSFNTPAPETNRAFARRFDELLRKELTRLGLFGTIVDATDKQPADMVITIFYVNLVYDISGPEFTVDVEMRLTGGSQPFWNRYQVVSKQYDTSEERLLLETQVGNEANTHRLLLAKVIPDIEAYVAANNKKPPQPGSEWLESNRAFANDYQATAFFQRP